MIFDSTRSVVRSPAVNMQTLVVGNAWDTAIAMAWYACEAFHAKWPNFQKNPRVTIAILFYTKTM